MKKFLPALILVLIPLFGFATEFKTVCVSRVSLNFSPCVVYKTIPNGNNSYTTSCVEHSSMDFYLVTFGPLLKIKTVLIKPLALQEPL